MKVRLISGMVALLVSVSAVMAGDEIIAPNAAGTKAILFTFNGLQTLGVGTFNGGIGGKYFITAPLAIRAALQFANSNMVIAANPAAGQTGKDGSSDATTFGISAGAEYHFLTSRVSPYGGAEVLFASTSTDAKSVVNTTAGIQTDTKNSAIGPAGMTLRVSALLGVEFFLTKELSLGGEYQLGLNMVSHPDEEQTIGPTTTTTKVGGTTSEAIGTAGLTLSVYF